MSRSKHIEPFRALLSIVVIVGGLHIALFAGCIPPRINFDASQAGKDLSTSDTEPDEFTDALGTNDNEMPFDVLAPADLVTVDLAEDADERQDTSVDDLADTNQQSEDAADAELGDGPELDGSPQADATSDGVGLDSVIAPSPRLITELVSSDDQWSVRVSPDGNTVCLLETKSSNQLRCFNIGEPIPSELPSVSHYVNDFQFAGNSRVVFRGCETLPCDRSLFSVLIASGDVTPLTTAILKPGTSARFEVTKDGKTVVFLGTPSGGANTQLFSVPADGGTVTRAAGVDPDHVGAASVVSTDEVRGRGTIFVDHRVGLLLAVLRRARRAGFAVELCQCQKQRDGPGKPSNARATAIHRDTPSSTECMSMDERSDSERTSLEIHRRDGKTNECERGSRNAPRRAISVLARQRADQRHGRCAGR